MSDNTDLIELLQANAAGLLTESQARDRLRVIRPEWFPTTAAQANTRGGWFARESTGTRQWTVNHSFSGGYVALFASNDVTWNREMAEDLAEELNNGGCEEPR